MTDYEAILAQFSAVKLYDLDGNIISARELSDQDILMLGEAFTIHLEDERARELQNGLLH